MAALKLAGRHRDPATTGLYMQLLTPTVRSWLFRYSFAGKAREMGLGPYPTVSLAEARRKAQEARRLLAAGIDPLAARKAQADAQAQAEAQQITFREATDRFIAAKSAEWRNDKHRAQWTSTLATYAYPIVGSLGVGDVGTPEVMRILEPIWTTKTETASRVRQRIERVLDWAATMGFREGANPARWRGHLENSLASPAKMRVGKHHPALPYGDLPQFWEEMAAHSSVAALCLRFTILTAARTGEAIGAKWDEIDRAARVWTIPPERMKAGRAHRVPLSDAALSALDALEPLRRDDGFVFPGMRAGSSLSNMAMLQLLKRMNRSDLTVHGFRSTFRDWCAEATSYPREVAEMALAHTIEDKTEAAYRRGDLFDKRARLMAAWAAFVTTPPAEGATVTPIRARG